MRRFLTTMLLGSLLAAIAVTGSQNLAHACSPTSNPSLDAEAFTRASDLDGFHASSGPVQDALDAWGGPVGPVTWVVGDPLPRIVGISRSTTVVYAQPPKYTFRGIAAIMAYDAVWGVAPVNGPGPTAFVFDTSSCAGWFEPPPLGESEWRIVTDPVSWIHFYPSPDQYDDLEVELDRLFGEPERPEANPGEMEARWQDIVTHAATHYESPITEVESLPGFEIATTVESAPTLTRNVGLAVAAIAAAAVGIWGWRRSGTTG